MFQFPRTVRTTRAAAAIVVLSLAAAGALALHGPVLAQTASAASAPLAMTAPAPAAAVLNFQQLVDSLAKLGYKDFREVERKSDKLYEVKARDARGAKMELTVDARSGEVLREEADH